MFDIYCQEVFWSKIEPNQYNLVKHWQNIITVLGSPVPIWSEGRTGYVFSLVFKIGPQAYQWKGLGDLHTKMGVGVPRTEIIFISKNQIVTLNLLSEI